MSKTSALADNIAALGQQIEALDPGEDKAKLLIRFQRAAKDLDPSFGGGESEGSEPMSAINLTPEPGDELVPMRNNQGLTELNIGTNRYLPDSHGIFWVERHRIDRALLTVGGFFESAPTKFESLRSVATAITRCPTAPSKTQAVASARRSL